MIEPLRNGILFMFLEKTDDSGGFKGNTDWGFDLGVNTDETSKRGRWARTIAVGPDVTDVKEDMFIYIEPLMWTVGFNHNGFKIWKTDETKILATSDEQPEL